MPWPMWEVDVPIQHITETGRSVGIHIFTGRADSPSHALRAARDAYDKALLLHRAGREIPSTSGSGSWGVRGLRPGWEIDWSAAKVKCWVNPGNLLRTPPEF